jgi:transposase
MTPIYGWAHKSKRVNEHVIDSRFKRFSVISTTRLNGKKASLIIEGSVNGEVFKHYVSKVLLPTLKKGDILILDNLSVHKTAGALDPVYKKGASVMYLPPYSPDFNPIEFEWSKLKSVVRNMKPQNHDDLIFAMQMALNMAHVIMIKNWFRRCGYK